jgi:hypothetical protein
MVCYLLRAPLSHAVAREPSPVPLLPSLLHFGTILILLSEETSTIVKQVILNCCSFIMHA